MSEQPVTRPGVTITRTGINYEAAVMSALIAAGMTGGQGPEPGQPARLAAARPEAEPELVAES